MRLTARHPLILRTNVTLSLRPIETPALVREAFFSKTMSDEKVQHYSSGCRTSPIVHFFVCCCSTCATGSNSTPLIVGGAADHLQPGRLQALPRPMVPAAMFPDTAHDMMLGRLAAGRRVAEWLKLRADLR
jgi:hypothetical protein